MTHPIIKQLDALLEAVANGEASSEAEKERLRSVKVNALSKLSAEEREVLGV